MCLQILWEFEPVSELLIGFLPLKDPKGPC